MPKEPFIAYLKRKVAPLFARDSRTIWFREDGTMMVDGDPFSGGGTFTLTAGPVDTLAPGSPATADIVNNVLLLGIPQGEDGADGINGTDGTDGTNGADGADGADGTNGTDGRNAGVRYTYSTTTSSGDPGSGILRFNNATLSSATELYISETDGDANGLAAWLATWDDSTSTIRGTLTLRKDSDPSIFYVFNITGTITDSGSWDTFTVAYVAGSGALSNADTVKLLFTATGLKGDAGATPTGAVIAERSAKKSDTQTLNTGSLTWTDITGLSITYAPTSASNIIKVRAFVQCGMNSALNAVVIRLMRDSTPIGIGDASGSHSQVSALVYNTDAGTLSPGIATARDTPATTSNTTYKVQFAIPQTTAASQAAYINRSHTDANNNLGGRAASWIEIEEVTP